MPQSGSIAEVSGAVQRATEPLFLRKLQRFRIAARHSQGTKPGNTPMRHGSQESGLEISSHKSYAPGDDLRYFDWNVYGRLQESLVKRFRSERESPLHLLIDASASMGTPSADGKLGFAAALAISLAYISLRQNDPVRIAVLLRTGATTSPLFRHPQRLQEVRRYLSSLTAHGPTALVEGTDAYLRTTGLPGTAVLLSDFLVPQPVYEDALAKLAARRFTVAALRVTGPLERDVDELPNRITLRDVETGTERVIDLTPSNRESYRAAVHDHSERLKTWCNSRAITYAELDTANGIESTVLHELPRAGLIY